MTPLHHQFIQTASARLIEPDLIEERTRQAIAENISQFWSTRHRDTMRDIEDLRKINQMILAHDKRHERRLQ
jgi:hypothetical protein